MERRGYVWIVRAPHGAALIDAGLDPRAKAVTVELKAEGVEPADVHTCLIEDAKTRLATLLR